MEIRAIHDEVFDLVYASAPIITGATVTLEALYGLDGANVGVDDTAQALVFPVDMSEVGTSGTYSTKVRLSSGSYWARINVDGSPAQVILVKVASADRVGDAQVDVPFTLIAVVPSNPSSVQVSMQSLEGATVGDDDIGVPITWPQAMAQAGSYTDSWYYETATFDEPSRVNVTVTPNNGSAKNDVIVVTGDPQEEPSVNHFNGWEPVQAHEPASWVTLGYIRRWTGWTTAHLPDKDLRELRRLAIETFVDQTNNWIPACTGTYHGMRGQGSRLYLPMSILLPQDGGQVPVVEYTNPEGDKSVVETLSQDDLIYRVRGRDKRMPFIERSNNWWDHTLDVRITATFGSVNFDKKTPMKVQQVLVGLIRWHSLSFGVDSDDARDQATLNRISSEGSRDMRVSYDRRATGDGLTGDRTIDRALAELTIRTPPWAYRGGDLPVEGGRG